MASETNSTNSNRGTNIPSGANSPNMGSENSGSSNSPSPSLFPQYLAALAATQGNLVMGLALSWSGPTGLQLHKPIQQGGLDMDDDEESWVGSLVAIGALVGGPLAGNVMGLLGRRGTMIVTCIMFSASFLFLVVAQNLWTIYLGRLATGLCAGMSSLVCPVYVSETASPKIRGVLGSGMQLMVTIGVVLGFVVGSLVSWRWLSVFCIGCDLVWIFLLLPIPETPQFYISKLRHEEAKASLQWLRGHKEGEEELISMIKSQEGTSKERIGLKDLVKRECLIPLGISMMLFVGQQLSGVSAVMFYTPKIFSYTGSSLSSNLESIIVAVVQAVATALGAALMDKTGRRVLLLFSSSLMILASLSLGGFFYVKLTLGNENLADKIEFLPLLSLSVFMFFFSIGFGPIPWLMMSELFPPKIRGPAGSISNFFAWFLVFMVTKFFTNLSAAVSIAGAFWIFAGIVTIVFFFCLFCVPETNGKSLEEIEDLFRSKDEPLLRVNGSYDKI